MKSLVYDYDDYDDGPEPNKRAPERAEIAGMTDRAALRELAGEASDVCIAIETQLQYLDTGDVRLKFRRVNALICWRRACKNAQSRLGFLEREVARA